MDPRLAWKHGLSLYVETQKHKLMFDMGQDELLLENAKILGIDLSAVDVAFLSHGHYDHGGGLPFFFRENKKAKVYMKREALKPYFSERNKLRPAYIGLKKNTIPMERLAFSEDEEILDEELALYSGIKQEEFVSKCNLTLLEEGENGEYRRDRFLHEQNLLIRENDRCVLLAGCAHNGIVNIVKQIEERAKCHLDAVIGGFHLHSENAAVPMTQEDIAQLAERLMKFHAHFYTCHCTGTKEYEQLKAIMKDRISYLAEGERLEL